MCNELEKKNFRERFSLKGPELRRVLFILFYFLFGQKSYASSALYLIG